MTMGIDDADSANKEKAFLKSASRFVDIIDCHICIYPNYSLNIFSPNKSI